MQMQLDQLDAFGGHALGSNVKKWRLHTTTTKDHIDPKA